MARATFLVCGPNPRGTYSVLANGSPIFCEMQAVEVARFVRAATTQFEVDVRYLNAGGAPHDRLPPDLAEVMEEAEDAGA